jgi:hypothetical protein
MRIIPITISDDKIVAGDTIPISFTELKLQEKQLEDFIRKNIDLIYPDEEESLLIVGQQVRDVGKGRSDLIAINSDGDLVLIEIKRDVADILHRTEPLEIQAIRYAATLATIEEPEEIIELFSLYIGRHKGEYAELLKERSSEEVARKLLKEFMNDNEIGDDFNEKQKIILIASGFDDNTLSACAWLARNNIDIRCIKLEPFKHNEQIHLRVTQEIPPLSELEDFFVGINTEGKIKKRPQDDRKAIERQKLPRMPWLLEHGVIQIGMPIEIIGHIDERAVVIDAYTVKYKDKIMKYNDWGQEVTGWSSICIYDWARPVGSNKKLTELRAEKMAELQSNEEKKESVEK